ncbi:MAG: carboxypeptidase regulatory-like domain-containing protein [Elusimicrobia bacterium]|nr:carboxypeptidase regulatory-like domain-containing protein [Elusimicrobiota bacterium]
MGKTKLLRASLVALLFTAGAEALFSTTSIQLVDSVDGSGTSIALNASGKPVIAYYYDINGELKYAEYDGSLFSVSIITNNCSGAVSLAFDLSPGTDAHIAFAPRATCGLYYACGNSSNGWTLIFVDTATPVDEASIAINPQNGYPAIAYHDSSVNCQLNYAYYDGTAWNIETVDNYSISGSSVMGKVSLAFESGGTPHISYFSSDGTNGYLKHADKPAAAWTMENIYTVSSVLNTSIKIDSSGYPHIVFTDDSLAPSKIEYIYNDAATWPVETVEDMESSYCSLWLDGRNNPHISYAWYNGTDHDLRVAFKTSGTSGGTWGKVDLDTGNDRGLNTSVVIDSSSTYHISYRDYSASNVYYAEYREGEYEPNNDFSYAYAIPKDTTVYSYIWTSDDADYFSFYLERRGTSTINLTNLPFDYNLYLYDANGATAAYSSSGGIAAEGISVYLTGNSTYYVKVSGFDGAYTSTGTYTLFLSFSPSNYAPTLSWTGETGFVSDGLDPETGDTSTNFTYRVKYTDGDGDAPYSGYPWVAILKGGVHISGSPFTLNYITGTYSAGAIYSITTALATEGTDYTYYFEARDSNDAAATGVPTSSVDAPDVSAPPTDEYYEPNDTLASAYSIDKDTVIYAYVWDSTDVDYFGFYVALAGTVTVSLTSLPFDYNIRLYDSGEVEISSSVSTGTADEQLVKFLDTPATYYVKVEGYNVDAYSSTDTYSLRVSFSPSPTVDTSYEPNNDFADAYGPLSAGTTYYAYIWTVDDSDYYKFYASGAGSVSIKLFSLPQDYNLYLYDDAQSNLASSLNLGFTDEIIYYDLLDAGTYYIFVDPQASYDTSSAYALVYDISLDSSSIASYSVSGYVYDDNRNPISGAVISVSGNASASATTDSSGYYCFSLPDGDYTITPSSSGWSFSPSYQDVVVSGGDYFLSDFTGYPVANYNISGRCIDNDPTNAIPDGAGLGDVLVYLYYNGVTYSSTTTAADGYFNFYNIVSRNYEIYAEYNGTQLHTGDDITTYYGYYPLDSDEFDQNFYLGNSLSESEDFQIRGNVFNPLSGGNCQIYFSGIVSGDVKITVYDAAGRVIKEWTESNVFSNIEWNGKDEGDQPVANGVYFIHIKSDKIDKTRPVAIAK